MNKKKIQSLIRQLLIEIGEDPDREGLRRTPERVAESYEFLLQGYRTNLRKTVNGAVFKSQANNMIIARDIEIFSLCEHHMLPFFGRCHIGYIAGTEVLGVSKLARIADMYSRRLQIQERLTAEIAHAVRDAIDCEGVGVVMECQHLCMMMRGVEKQNSVMTTSSVLGSFHKDIATRAEFMNLITTTASHRNI